MRVVLDTNVLLAGMLTRGLGENLLDACLGARACGVVVSEHILQEFTRHAGGKFRLPPDGVRQAIDYLRKRTELIEPLVLPPGACDDPDDLPVLGTAVAARADALVTGDAALLKLGTIHGIPILSPRAFYDRLR